MITHGISYMGKFWWGKIWQTVQVKAIGKGKFGE